LAIVGSLERRVRAALHDRGRRGADALGPSDFSLVQSSEKVLRRLSGELRLRTAPETHASVIELVTGVHADVPRAVAELAALRAQLALHVHVGIPDPQDAIRVLNGLRGGVPVLLALSANSPFCKGRDSGFASSRTTIFQGFPRTGTARRLPGALTAGIWDR